VQLSFYVREIDAVVHQHLNYAERASGTAGRDLLLPAAVNEIVLPNAIAVPSDEVYTVALLEQSKRPKKRY
jgi:hypothetical protein